MGHDERDAQLLERPGELRGVAPALKLLVPALRLPGRALEDAMPIAIEGHRHAAAVDDLLEHEQVAVGVLLFSE